MIKSSHWYQLSAPPARASSGGGGVVPPTNRTAEYISSEAGDFSLTGSDVNTWGDHGANADLAITYVSGTKVVRGTTHPINGTVATVDTNNADCEYNTPVGGTLADYWPSGVGSVYLVIYVDSHPDRFNDPDPIFEFGTALRCQIQDGPILVVDTNAGGQSTQPSGQSISLDAWHLISIRSSAGAGNLKVQIDDGTEVSVTGATVATLTSRMVKWYDTGGGGRFDGAEAHEVWYSVAHSDAQRDAVKAGLRALYTDI
jgi:hypothetical protein